MRDKLLNTVKKAIEEEIERTYTEYGFDDFHSAHEGYAVLKEEVEEADHELDRIKNKLNWFWNAVKRNEYTEETILLINYYAQLLACEAIQIAAMAQKNITSLNKQREDEEHGNKI